MGLTQRIVSYIKHNPKRVFMWGLVLVLCIGFFILYQRSNFSLEGFITHLWEQYVEDWGYVILFFGVFWRVSLGLFLPDLLHTMVR